MHAVQAFRPKAGSVAVGMAVLPEGSSDAHDSAAGPWLLLVTANVRFIWDLVVLLFWECICIDLRRADRWPCCQQGLAKRVALGDVPQKNRGGPGLALLKTNEGDRLIALHVVGSGAR